MHKQLIENIIGWYDPDSNDPDSYYWPEAQRKIDNAIDRALYEGFKGVKIIHGHGGYGHTSIIKNKAVPYLARYAENHRCKLVRDKFTEGAHIIYF